jgi:hypothetical protein
MPRRGHWRLKAPTLGNRVINIHPVIDVTRHLPRPGIGCLSSYDIEFVPVVRRFAHSTSWLRQGGDCRSTLTAPLPRVRHRIINLNVVKAD